MIPVLLSRLILLLFGTLYPAYASYKTVKTKNVRDYVQWMIYWIVFALYTCIEIFTDIFIEFWFPLYYELKIAFVLWLICPATRGSTYIFKKIINPQLSKHEPVLDAHIGYLGDQGYDLLLKIGAQVGDYLVRLILELLSKCQIAAANYLPKLNEIARSNFLIQNSDNNSVAQNNLDDTALNKEDFDILMMENPELDNNAAATSSRKMHPEESKDSNTDSLQTEDIIPVKKRPLRTTAAKSKTKMPRLRERKKKNTKN